VNNMNLQTRSAATFQPGFGDDARPPRVLLVTSSLGNGHVRAAEAIADALRTLHPRVRIRTLDFWSLMNPGVAESIRSIYLEFVLHSPELYDRVYALDEHTWRRIIENDQDPPAEVLELIEVTLANRTVKERIDSWLGPYPSDLILFPTFCATLPTRSRSGNVASTWSRMLLLKAFWLRLQRRMQQHLERLHPDVVVATQMVPAALVSAIKREHDLALPLIGVLTDFGVHDYWLQRGMDLYCVPHESICAPFRDLPGANVEITGVPLVPGFATPPDPVASRVALGLDPQRPVVLVLGGGLGIGVETVARQLLARISDVQLLVLTGHNEAAHTELARLAASHVDRLVVLRWTDDMPACMAAASIVVGKPGGLTVAESLASGRPLLATRSLRGQEGFNVRFLEQHGVGRLVNDQSMPECIEQWLRDPHALVDAQTRARSLSRRSGAMLVARRALEHAQHARAARRAGAAE
jgi:processive 1,2-diacylglycerol beta-glucosyltransferase